MKAQKIVRGVIFCLSMLVVLLIAGGCFKRLHEDRMRISIIEQEYYPLDEVMHLNGYEKSMDYAYQKSEWSVPIIITFDFTENVCKKNLYEFSLDKAIFWYDEEAYVYREVLEKILNCELTYVDGAIVLNEKIYTQHEWTEAFEPLIAHAGGAVREETYNAFYCNSIEALVENYNLGHRVFEFDFSLTSDNQLAVVHDWNHQWKLNGEIPTAEEWRNFVSLGTPEGEFTAMMIEDLLEEMMVNKDLFLVTDTKLTGEEAKVQFQLIYDAAGEINLELLDRVIPQIYNEEMYDYVMSVYEFPSVIYTVYATGATGKQVIEFAKQKENIKVITAPVDDVRFGQGAIEELHKEGLLIYNHTLYSFEELTEGKAKGIDGFYSSLLLPRDMEL